MVLRKGAVLSRFLFNCDGSGDEGGERRTALGGLYADDRLHLSGKGAAVLAEGMSGAVASGLGKVRYLN